MLVVAPWMMEEVVYGLRQLMLGEDVYVLKPCQICKGYYWVFAYVDKLLCCSECSQLSRLLQQREGMLPDRSKHLFP